MNNKLYTLDSETLEFKPYEYKSSNILLIVCCVVLCFINLYLLQNPTIKIVETIKYKTILSSPSLDSLNYSKVREFVLKMRIKFPEVVMAQCILESGNLSSPIALVNNNILGLKVAHQRPTTAICDSNKYAFYANWKDCIRDYAIWQCKYDRNNNYNNQDQFIKFLAKYYSEDKEYSKKLKQIINDRI